MPLDTVKKIANTDVLGVPAWEVGASLISLFLFIRYVVSKR